jgi:hypothetical protein
MKSLQLPDSLKTRSLTLKARRHAIRTVLEARFSVAAFDKIRGADPTYWASPRNDMGRGIYGEAMREKRRLQAVTDGQLEAEVRAIRAAS